MTRAFWSFVFISVLFIAVTFSTSPTGAISLEPASVETNSTGSIVNAPVAGVPLAPVADIVQLDDFILDGSLCAGTDCVNGESFFFDTIRLKENNLRIRFEDTSNSASFPNNDWALVANDTSNGGRNYFAIEDAGRNSSTSTLAFLIEAGASENALYVEGDSDVGLGTADPATKLHMVDSDSPTLRLEQDTTAGWGAKAWDIGGNEGSLFIRDVTSGTVPIQIAGGASTNSLYVSGDGKIGVGTTTPTATLHVEGSAHINGTFTRASDRNLKENIEAADTDAILDQILDTPVYYWNYTADEQDVTHLGPMAQDFNAASELGSDTTIDPLDVTGALIASVQALNTELENKDSQIEALETENNELEARLEALEAAVAQILANEAEAETGNNSEE